MIYLYPLTIVLIVCSVALNIGTQLIRSKKRRLSRWEDAYADA